MGDDLTVVLKGHRAGVRVIEDHLVAKCIGVPGIIGGFVVGTNIGDLASIAAIWCARFCIICCSCSNCVDLAEIKIVWEVGRDSGEISSVNLVPAGEGTIRVPGRGWQAGEILNLGSSVLAESWLTSSTSESESDSPVSLRKKARPPK